MYRLRYLLVPHGHRLFTWIIIFVVGAFFVSLDSVIAQESKEKNSKEKLCYVLKVPKETKILNYKFPDLEYRRIEGAKINVVLIRAAYSSKAGIRTEMNAGNEPITLKTNEGILKPKIYADTLGMLLRAFGVKGDGILMFAVYDSEAKERLSPWLEIPATFK